MVKKAQLADQSADYERLGVKAGTVEPRGDGKRDDDRSGAYEWWYFDALMEDGTKTVIHFNTKDLGSMKHDGAIPSVVIKLTTSDGKDFESNMVYGIEESSFEKGACNVSIGPRRMRGDLRTYRIHVEPQEGVGADLVLTSTSTSWRPGSGYIYFGEGHDD